MTTRFPLRAWLFGITLLTGALMATPAQAGPDDAGNGPGYLGVRLQSIESGLAEALDWKKDHGVLLGQIVPESPAGQSGLAAGDIVLRVNGEKVHDPAEMRRVVRSHSAGEELTIQYSRDGKKHKAAVVLGELPVSKDDKGPRRIVRHRDGKHKADFPFGVKEKMKRKTKEKGKRGFLGVMLQKLQGDLPAFFEVESGALVTKVEEGTPAEKLGLRAGDVITKLNDEEIASPADLHAAMRKFEEATEVDVVWMRKGRERSGAVEIEIRESKGGMFSRNWINDDGEGRKMIKMEFDDMDHLDIDEHVDKLHELFEERGEEREALEESLRRLQEEVGVEIKSLREEIKKLREKDE